MNRWETGYLPIAESIAAIVRKRFRRAGSGPAFK